MVAPLLAEGERVWAVFPARTRSLVVTPRRIFVVAPDHADEIPLEEVTDVSREGDTLIVVQLRHGQPLAIDVDPADEHGLQALTVIGLLAACRGRIPAGLEPEPPVPARRRLVPPG